MRTAKEIINEFKAIADNPRKAMDDYKKETGIGAVGIMPVYCPEEIVHAAGYLPIGMWGAQKKQISKAPTPAMLGTSVRTMASSDIKARFISKPLSA